MLRRGRLPRYTIIQISDPHVPADGLLFDRVDTCARVQASVDAIAAAGCAPDVLVLSGDLANAGEEQAYVRLRPVLAAAARRFDAELLVAPGNHDDVAHLREQLLGLGLTRARSTRSCAWAACASSGSTEAFRTGTTVS